MFSTWILVVTNSIQKNLKSSIALDLFAGGEGMSLRFEIARFNILAAGETVETNPIHCANYVLTMPIISHSGQYCVKIQLKLMVQINIKGIILEKHQQFIL